MTVQFLSILPQMGQTYCKITFVGEEPDFSQFCHKWDKFIADLPLKWVSERFLLILPQMGQTYCKLTFEGVTIRFLSILPQMEQIYCKMTF